MQLSIVLALLAFWQAVVQKARISAGFREIAQGHALALAGMLRGAEN